MFFYCKFEILYLQYFLFVVYFLIALRMDDKCMFFRKFGLTNNQLKIIAVIAMLCDHIGKELFPQATVLQIIGRIAFPVFAFMIAEGCFYTRDKKKYLLKIAVLAVGCQLVYFIAERSFYQNVLVTFSLSILLIFVAEYCLKKRNAPSALLLIALSAFVLLLVFAIPRIVKGFQIDYGIFGLLLPVAVYFAPNKPLKLIVSAVFLSLLSAELGGIQWYSLIAVIFIALYNGKRGRLNLKYLFYIFYPAHLALIYLVKMLFF